MATIEELKREIQREKNYEESEREMNNLGIEKKQLEKQLKQMKFKRKFGKYIPNVKPVVSEFKKLGKEIKKIQEEQNSKDRQSKSIKKRKSKQYTQRRGLGLFG